MELEGCTCFGDTDSIAKDMMFSEPCLKAVQRAREGGGKGESESSGRVESPSDLHRPGTGA